MRRLLPVTAALIFLGGCRVPKLVSAHFAKEVCSCLFVYDQPESYCIDYAQPMFSIGTYGIDWEKKRVTATKLGLTSEAALATEPYGCELQGG